MKQVSVFLIAFLLIVAANIAQAERGYLARSYCSSTERYGLGFSSISQQTAINSAIESCIDNGGIPNCCRNDARVTGSAYRAYAHCSATNVRGVGYGFNLQDAMNTAVSSCINRGGIPQCCRNGLSY